MLKRFTRRKLFLELMTLLKFRVRKIIFHGAVGNEIEHFHQKEENCDTASGEDKISGKTFSPQLKIFRLQGSTFY